MCGVYFSNVSDIHAKMIGSSIRHRGMDSVLIKRFRNVFLGLNRLSLVGVADPNAEQPLDAGASLIAFNGEIYNSPRLGGPSEIMSIEKVMRQYPNNFERFLDGYYAIVRIDKGRERVIVSRDPIGVMPLYYKVDHKNDIFMVASESKALGGDRRAKEVKPGETIEFDFHGYIKKRRRFDPISLHQETLHMPHLRFLFNRAVTRRQAHADSTIDVTIALSGGLDSAMVLAAAATNFPHSNHQVDAITITMDGDDPHVERCKKLCKYYDVKLTVIVLNAAIIRRHWPMIRFYLEDEHPNVIKHAAMIRNYFVAMSAHGKVILCGEGADELGGGYPSHAGKTGIELAWKCYSTLRSMHAINLDRVNKGGMAHTKEFRVPFLDRALVQYMMGCEKPEAGKQHFKRLARIMGLPSFVIDQPKFNIDDTRFRDLARDLIAGR